MSFAEPMSIAIAANPAPVHPQLGEIAVKKGKKWQRLNANFFRPSDATVISLSTRTRSQYRVTHRTLQSVSGAAVERGREVLMHETFGNEAFFGDVVSLHELLNNVDPVSAVTLGVQVDINKVPEEIVAVMVGDDLDAKDAALLNPVATRALIKAGAILVLTSFARGAGQAVVDILNSWGPGLFDICALPDNVLEDNVVNPTMNPPISNFVDLEEQDYGFGWDGLFVNDGINNNALASRAEAVYDLVMHANGAFGMPNGTLPPELAIVPPEDLIEALVLAEINQPGNDVVPADTLPDRQAGMRSMPSRPTEDCRRVFMCPAYEVSAIRCLFP